MAVHPAPEMCMLCPPVAVHVPTSASPRSWDASAPASPLACAPRAARLFCFPTRKATARSWCEVAVKFRGAASALKSTKPLPSLLDIRRGFRTVSDFEKDLYTLVSKCRTLLVENSVDCNSPPAPMRW